MYETRLDLPVHLRKEMAVMLQTRLSEALDLEAQAKQAHWTVRGREFIALHTFFDGLHGDVETFADLVAERIAALGAVPDGRIATTAASSGLYGYALETRSGEEHLRAIAASLGQFGKAARTAIEQASREGDAVTADIMTGIARTCDKLLWQVEAHLA